MTSPRGDQCEPMSTVERPVTETAETAVKSASTSGVALPDADAFGCMSKIVKVAVSTRKTPMTTREGEASSRRCIQAFAGRCVGGVYAVPL